MNKHELLEAVVKTTRLPKSEVVLALETALEIIQTKVAKGEDVTLSGFGTFTLSSRKASKGFNPHTGKSIDLPEIAVLKFRAGKGFKEKLKK